MKIGIIGSGIGGLASAVRMAAQGNDVTVYEKNNFPGGKISELYLNGYCFDTGPSLFTMPSLMEEVFRICGEDCSQWLPYEQLDVNCKYFFPDGTVFNFYHDKDLLEREIEEKTHEMPENVFYRLEKSREVYEISAPVFLFSAFHKLSNFNTPPYKNIAGKLHKLDFFKTMHDANESSFSDVRMVQVFDRYATYNGSNPYHAPATLNMIAHLENNIGAFFPKKGMYAIVDCLYKLAVKKGVEFLFDTEVKKIIVKDKKATGIIAEKHVGYYDLIISDADVRYVANKLLHKHPMKKRLNKSNPSSSALIFYWGVNREFPELDLHNILFSRNYKGEFKTLFDEKNISDDPTVYLFISSKVVQGDAPAGCENWFVMVNAPANAGQDWEELAARTRKNIISKINRTLGVDIENHIVEEAHSSPVTIEENTFSQDGALYGTSSNSMLSAFRRHPNFLRGIKNLYFVGGSVHPGGGIPLCLASAKIVEEEITARYA